MVEKLSKSQKNLIFAQIFAFFDFSAQKLAKTGFEFFFCLTMKYFLKGTNFRAY